MTDAAELFGIGDSLRDPKWGLCWSNSGISDEVLVRKALISGGFTVILMACLEFGLDYVRTQWEVVDQHVGDNSELISIRTRSLVNEILDNIAEGFCKARS
ncbi:MAG: hypothetical protein PHQ58_07605 [Rhodoferax sp.]|uniref:hypothetical protein n=1 Tax=Rhodoferax sp. TaxID=50421 RepID=UPI00260841DD|nr:hypothetical protein [Rhodoferax sp.]MDD2880288.1 hypothetical protein [Rhodoferax sp.]